MYNMDEREKILRENVKEYLDFGEQALKLKKFNSAVTLFFKAISEVLKEDAYKLKKMVE